MEPMTRITPEILATAYQQCGLKPARGAWFQMKDGVECGCGMAAMYLVANPDGKHSPVDGVLWAREAYPGGYMTGFLVGFDNWTKDGVCQLSGPADYIPERYRDGYFDGWTCAGAVLA